MNSNSVFLHLLRFFLLGCEKAACTHARYARIDSNRSKRKYFTLELRSIDRYGATGAIYRKRDQHRHLSTENTCRPENLPCKSVVLENETKKKKEKREKQERKEREKERGGRERKREKKKLVRENSNHRQTDATCQVWVDRRAKWYVLLSLSFAPSVWTFTGIKKS